MKKKDLATLAIFGIAAGSLLGSCNGNGGDHGRGRTSKVAAAEQMNPEMQAFYNALSVDQQRKFLDLDAQHRMMAVEMANQSCNGQNTCAGQGGCATAVHNCAGLNDCKGQGGAPVQNPNKAVDIQYQNQLRERQKLQGDKGMGIDMSGDSGAHTHPASLWNDGDKGTSDGSGDTGVTRKNNSSFFGGDKGTSHGSGDTGTSHKHSSLFGGDKGAGNDASGDSGAASRNRSNTWGGDKGAGGAEGDTGLSRSSDGVVPYQNGSSRPPYTGGNNSSSYTPGNNTYNGGNSPSSYPQRDRGAAQGGYNGSSSYGGNNSGTPATGNGYQNGNSDPTNPHDHGNTPATNGYSNTHTHPMTGDKGTGNPQSPGNYSSSSQNKQARTW